jgi:hypothetical protein
MELGLCCLRRKRKAIAETTDPSLHKWHVPLVHARRRPSPPVTCRNPAPLVAVLVCHSHGGKTVRDATSMEKATSTSLNCARPHSDASTATNTVRVPMAIRMVGGAVARLIVRVRSGVPDGINGTGRGGASTGRHPLLQSPIPHHSGWPPSVRAGRATRKSTPVHDRNARRHRQAVRRRDVRCKPETSVLPPIAPMCSPSLEQKDFTIRRRSVRCTAVSSHNSEGQIGIRDKRLSCRRGGRHAIVRRLGADRGGCLREGSGAESSPTPLAVVSRPTLTQVRRGHDCTNKLHLGLNVTP